MRLLKNENVCESLKRKWKMLKGGRTRYNFVQSLKNKTFNIDLENCVIFNHNIMMDKGSIDNSSQNLIENSTENSIQNLSSKKENETSLKKSNQLISKDIRSFYFALSRNKKKALKREIREKFNQISDFLISIGLCYKSIVLAPSNNEKTTIMPLKIISQLNLNKQDAIKLKQSRKLKIKKKLKNK